MIDYYGQMSDGINAGQASDRVLLTWDLTVDPPPPRRQASDQSFAVLSVDPGGRPEQHDAPTDCAHITIGIPSDIERLRRENAPLSHEWRIALRRDAVAAARRGWRVTGFDRAGRYILDRS